jgi:mono/diheme cytochrome c family protein
MKKTILTVIAVILIEIIVLIIGAYSGIPDVSATKPEGKITDWFLNTTRDHSIHSRVERIAVPSLNDSSLVTTGFEHYNEMCVTCHGAPGREPDELAQGLNPPAPDLVASTTDLSPAEMFLIVKDGIKMTGMPAWGSTHSDSAIWAIVAFLQRLQTLTPETYKAFQNSQSQEKIETREHNIATKSMKTKK